ncbi:MAG TPA: AAA family ATPase [Trebonia sp.]|nr:AAA family ATPase [Trebonia sp.]
MSGFEPLGVPAGRLYGRRTERRVLDELLDGARAGRSSVLVVRGEAGVGKTALLDEAVGSVPDMQVARAAGVESEMELPFAALHQLCGPMLDRLERLPDPQRDALSTAFGLAAGPPPDRFLVGLAVLSLLSEVAGERPLVCVVDNAQWLDRASAQALGFSARRLRAESVLMLFAAREPGPDLAGLPELLIEGLREDDAKELLVSVVRWPLDARVRDQIVAETQGNPLALLELPRGLSPAQLAGGFALPDVLPVPDRIEQNFLRRAEELPAQTRRLLVLAAADPAGDPALVRRAAGRLGIAPQAESPASDAGLLDIGIRVRFRHPLVRSAAYRAASPSDRQRAHAALAEATDPQIDPDRRAWHRAQATVGPDEGVAEELERAAGRAQARGGLAAAAAFLERAAALTPDPVQQAGRALAAAQAKIQAGAFDAALSLLGMAEAVPLDALQRARVDLLHAQLAFVANRGSDAPPLLLRAAKRLERIDAGLARATYLDAINAAMFAGHLAGPGAGVLDVAREARAAPPAPAPPRAPDLLLDGLAANFCEGYATGLPILRRALNSFGRDTSPDEELRWLWLACVAALHLWDDERWDVLSRRHVELARQSGALSELPLALSSRVYMLLFSGELTTAASLVEEVQAAKEATGSNLAPYGALGLAALRGHEDEASALIEATGKEVAQRGEGIGATLTQWAAAVLHNGLGRHEQALAAAERGSEYPAELGLAAWSLAELIEAAARTGHRERAAAALEQLSETTSTAGTDWALGVQARSLALLSDGEAAGRSYREAIERLGRARVRADLARAHLVHGEWLRREKRVTDAREQLRTAHQMLTAMGMEAFAERARRELLATGETVRKSSAVLAAELTPQEAQIAWRARDGRTNAEIGAELFLSPRTVEWHLRKVFTKLGITSRAQLRQALPDTARAALSA